MKSEQPIRVAIFGHYMPIYRKGVLEKLSANNGIELTVYSTENFPAGLRMIKPDEVSFRLVNIETNLLTIPLTKKYFAWQPAMVTEVLTRRHDVFILPNIMSYLDVWMCLFLSRIIRNKICLWGHGKGSLKGKVSGFVRNKFMNLADSLLFYSDAAKESWGREGLPEEKMFVAYNALDTDESALVRSEISDRNIVVFLKNHGLENKKIIVFTGRLQERKRPDLIVDAMALIVAHVPEAHAVIIGDGVMMETIKKRISELSLEEHVTLAGAVFDEKIIAHYLLSAKLAVMPAAAGLFIQQVFDYGLPIVVGDNMKLHGPEIELVKDGENGLFFEDGNTKHLAAQVVKLLEDEEIRLAMAEKARKMIRDKYNVNTMSEGLLRAICYSVGKPYISKAI